MLTTTVPGDGHTYYGTMTFWNVFDAVLRYQNALAGDDPDADAYAHFTSTYGTFERALIVNCGNGWVERALLERGIIGSAVGIDIAADLIEEATRKAAGLPLRYLCGDTNIDPLPEGPFDLIVNHGAAHHIANIDRVFRRCAELLLGSGDRGLFVHHDYVGPHRNQYSGLQWEASWRVNALLPAERARTFATPTCRPCWPWTQPRRSTPS